MFVKLSKYLSDTGRLQDRANDAERKLIQTQATLTERDATYYERQLKEYEKYIATKTHLNQRNELEKTRRQRDDYKLKYEVLAAANKTQLV